MFINAYRHFRQTALAFLVLAGAAALAPSENAHAADKRYTVTLPSFTVTLNGQTVDNRNRDYPLIVYNDITYFPMTWFDCRFLGLENAWSPEQGLSVRQSNVTAPYHDYASAEANTSRSYRAELADGSITVNGQAIDNRSEEYPLLSFRDITYFPLTWRFAHDAFGWDYSYTDAEGLAIRSSNPQVKDAGLPGYAANNGFAVYKGYYYFVETIDAINHVYRSPLSDPGAREQVYEYEYSTTYGPNPRLSFSARDGGLWLSYHMGGGIMGHDEYVKLHEDGTAEKGPSGKVDFRDSSLGRVLVSYFVAPSPPNLMMIPSGSPAEAELVVLGDPSMIYGWAISISDDGGTNYATGNLQVVGTDLYTHGSSYPLSPENRQNSKRIWRIDLKTGNPTLISREPVDKFKVTGDGRILYVKASDGLLYASDLDGRQEMLLSGQQKVYEFSSVGEEVFFTVLEDGWLHRLFRAENGKEATAVSDQAFSAVYFANDRILAQAPGNMPTLNIYDSQSKLLTRIVGKTEALFQDGEYLLLRLADEPLLKVFQF